MTRDEAAALAVETSSIGTIYLRTAWNDFVIEFLGQHCPGLDVHLYYDVSKGNQIPYSSYCSSPRDYVWSIAHFQHVVMPIDVDWHEEVVLSYCEKKGHYIVLPVAELIIPYEVDRHGFPWLNKE